MPGLPRGRAALSRLIVREGQRREGRELRREGITPAAGVVPRFPPQGQGAGDSFASSPRGGECAGPAASSPAPAGTGRWMRGDGAPAPRLPPAWRAGAALHLQGSVLEKFKAAGKGGRGAGGGPAAFSPCLCVPRLPHAESAGAYRDRGGRPGTRGLSVTGPAS